MIYGINYVPFVYSKGAESRAIRHLDPYIKGLIFPILSIRPDGNKDFEATLVKLKAITDGLRFGLDLDREKLGKSKNYPAKDQFDALFDSNNAHQNYYDVVTQWQGAVPLLQSNGVEFDSVENQIQRAHDLDRGIVIPINRWENYDLQPVLSALEYHEIDRVFVVNSGWSLDVLQAENWASESIRIITEYFPEAEICCVSSSFPNDFQNIDRRGVFTNDDRELFDRLKRRHNSANLVYGDWASTRKSEERITSKPRPRIDIATQREWICFRRSNDEDGFLDVAERVMLDRVWLETPYSWGKRTVELTASDIIGKITGTEITNSVRINMHITIQAMEAGVQEIPEEPYTDNF